MTPVPDHILTKLYKLKQALPPKSRGLFYSINPQWFIENDHSSMQINIEHYERVGIDEDLIDYMKACNQVWNMVQSR